MILSRVSIQRPVLATMMNLVLVLFGIIGLSRLPVRELPDIDPPIVLHSPARQVVLIQILRHGEPWLPIQPGGALVVDEVRRADDCGVDGDYRRQDLS